MKKRYLFGFVLLTALVVTYFMGEKVPRPTYTEALPRVQGDLEKLADEIEAREAEQPVREGNDARVRFHNKTPKRTEYAVVYLHGFGGSFRDGYPVNYQLADSLKANMFLARWGAHGLRPPHSLVGFTAESAWADAREALAIGKALGEKVIILSTSTGGTLAMKLAAEFPEGVYALVNFSPNVKDDMPGSWLLGTPWGPPVASLIGFGDGIREVSFEEPGAAQYFDTALVSSALVDLQVLVSTTMSAEVTYNKITCPVLTLYYHQDEANEDERVEVDAYPEVHAAFATPSERNVLKALPTPGTHFLGSRIMSDDWETPLLETLAFLRGLE